MSYVASAETQVCVRVCVGVCAHSTEATLCCDWVVIKKRAVQLGVYIHPTFASALPRNRDVFVRSVVSAPIWLVLVVDQGEASQTQLLLGHRIARLLLASLSERDRVAVLLASDRIHHPADGPQAGEEGNRFYAATDETKSVSFGLSPTVLVVLMSRGLINWRRK